MFARADKKTEILAGVTTFLTSAYIVVVNPTILSVTGAPFSALLTATVLVSAFSTIAMGLYANNPILLAPGMGLNAFVAYTMVVGLKIPIETALGAVFWSGVIFLLLSIFNVRELIAGSIPVPLQKAISSGIGIFVAFIGLKEASMVKAHQATLITAGELTPSVLTFLIGLAVTAILLIRKCVGGMLLGVVATTIMAIPIGHWWGEKPIVVFKGLFDAPDFSLLFALDFTSALKFAYIPAILTLVITDLLDSLSAFVGIARAGKLLDKNGRPLRMKKSLIVDAAATTASGLLGTSPATSFIESATGIQQGGRTGLTAVVAGALFLPLLFLSPLLSTIPAIATAPALVLVGAFMMAPVSSIDWSTLEEAIPAFIAVIFIPLTFSISGGIVWSFLAYTLCKIATGKFHKLSRPFIALNAICLVMIVLSSH